MKEEIEEKSKAPEELQLEMALMQSTNNDEVVAQSTKCLKGATSPAQTRISLGASRRLSPRPRHRPH